MSEELFKEWANKPLWTLDESWALCNGKDPEEKLDPNYFLRSDANLFDGGITQAEAEGFDPKLGSPLKMHFTPLDVVDLVNRHIAAQNLTAIKVDGSEEPYFKRRNIVLFFTKYTEVKPPQPLLDAIGIAEKAQPIIKTTLTRGRKKNTGVINDEEKIIKIKALISSGEARSNHDAANKVIDAEGVSGASHNADLKRLLKKLSVSSS